MSERVGGEVSQGREGRGVIFPEGGGGGGLVFFFPRSWFRREGREWGCVGEGGGRGPSRKGRFPNFPQSSPGGGAVGRRADKQSWRRGVRREGRGVPRRRRGGVVCPREEKEGGGVCFPFERRSVSLCFSRGGGRGFVFPDPGFFPRRGDVFFCVGGEAFPGSLWELAQNDPREPSRALQVVHGLRERRNV